MTTHELTDYGHCQAALKMPQLKQALYDDGAILMDQVLVTLHGDQHRQRRLTEMRVFRRDFFRRYEHEVVPGIFSDVMSGTGQKTDLVDLGYHFMVYLAMAFAGVDRQSHTAAELATLVEMLRMFGVAATLGQAHERDKAETTAAVQASLQAFDQQFFTPSMQHRVRLLADVQAGRRVAEDLPMDVLTVLLQDDDKLDLPRDMLLREVAFYFLAGAHTSVHSLSHAIHHMLDCCRQTPGLRQQLQADPALVQRYVHESFRLHPSSPVSKRRVLSEVELPDGTNAARDDIVIVNLRVANRQQSLFGADAAEFNPARQIQTGISETGLTFGTGMHACLGKNLAAGTLPVPGKAVDAATHQWGTVCRIAHGLLLAGIAADPEQPPQLDQAIARETWLRYPVVFG